MAMTTPITPVQHGPMPRPFFPAFGYASFVLAVAATILPGIFARMVPAAGGIDADLRKLFVIGVVVGALLLSGSGVVLGLLSLFGFGKVAGRSRPIAGFFGMLLGGLVTAVWLSFPSTMERAKQAATKRAEQAAKAQAERVGIPGPFHHAESGLVLRKPESTWILMEGANAQKIDPRANAVTLNNAPRDEDLILGTVMVEKLADVDPDALDVAQMTETFVQNVSLREQQLEKQEVFDFAGQQAGHYQMTALSPAGIRMRYNNVLLIRNGYLVQLVAFGTIEKTANDGSSFAPFYDAISFED
jgi:hypothetical protein